MASPTGIQIEKIKVTLADDGTFNLPAVNECIVTIWTEGFNEGGQVHITDSGVVTILGGSGTTNFVATDTDTKLCVYDGGNYGIVKNRLGATVTVNMVLFR